MVDSSKPKDQPALASLNLEDAALNDQERSQLKTLLLKYQHSDTDLPGTNVCEHKIVVSNETPIKQKSYRVPQSKRAALDEKLDSMLEAGIISPSCSHGHSQ